MDSCEGALSGLRLIVVEDDWDSGEMLRQLLRFSGAAVVVFGTAREALGALAAAEPDVVIADMMLGKTDGIRLIRDARKHGSRAPFIAVSGRDYALDTLKQSGFAAFLRKPIDHTRLIDAIRAVVPQRARANAPPEDYVPRTASDAGSDRDDRRRV